MKSKLKLFFVAISFFAFSAVLAMEDNEKKPREIANEALGSAIVDGNLKGIRNAIAQGADVNASATFVDERGYPHFSFISVALVKWENFPPEATKIVRILLKYKANPNLADKYGMVPLHFAAKRGLVECQRLLLEYGALVNYKSVYGYNALYCAVFRNNKPYSVLLAAGADPGTKGYSSLSPATSKGNIQFFKDLISIIPAQDVIQAKREAAVALLLCFKRFKTEYGVKVKIPKDIQRMFCNYCAPGIADVDVLENKKIDTLQKWFSRENGRSITQYYYGPKYWLTTETGDDGWREDGYREFYGKEPFTTIKSLTDLENLDQHRPTIRKNILKALQDTPLWPIKRRKYAN